MSSHRRGEAPSKILIVRTSAMGDVVHCLPVLAALRRAWPEAKIAWVVEAAFAPLLEGHPDLDELLVVRLRQWRREPFSRPVRREVMAFLRALRGFGADLALDLMGNHKGALLARLSGAGRTVGWARPHRREPSSALWLGETVPTPAPHAVDRVLELLTGLGLEPGPADFGGEKILRPPAEAQPSPGQEPEPFLVIQAGAGWGNKCYPPKWWGEVAWRLREATGMAARVPIAPGEDHLARQVAEASRGAAETVEAAGLPSLAALLRTGRLVLGGDTGPIHLAQALGTPVLCLIGPTDPRRNGPYGDPRSVLWHRLPCSFCYKRMAGTKACLLDISPGEVVERALELLAS